MEEEKPKKNGRPTKLTKTFLEIADEIINNDINAIIHTDEELLLLINEKLEGEEKISQRTFERWKAKSNKVDDLDKIGKSFVALIKKALIKQKQYLFEELRGDDKAWQRWAWIIERKFDDWNIRHKTEYGFGNEINSIEVIVKQKEKNETKSETGGGQKHNGNIRKEPKGIPDKKEQDNNQRGRDGVK